MWGLDVIAANLQVPAIRPGSVFRTGLINHPRTVRSIPVVTVVAPAGYGRTTLPAQWAARDERPFARVSIEEQDNIQELVLVLDKADLLHAEAAQAVAVLSDHLSERSVLVAGRIQ